MNLGDAVVHFKDWTGFTNPIATSVSTLQATITGLVGFNANTDILISTVLQPTATSADSGTIHTDLTNIVRNMPTILPLMNANDAIEKKLATSQTSLPHPPPPTTPGTNFVNSVAPVTDFKTQLDSLNTIINTNLLLLQVGDLGAIATVTSADTAVNSAISASYSNANSAITGAGGTTIAAASTMTTIRAYSFATYVSTTQPSYVKDVLDTILTYAPPYTT